MGFADQAVFGAGVRLACGLIIMGHSCKTGNVRYGGTSKTQN